MWSFTNKIKDKNWEKKLKKFKLDPTLKWEFAEIVGLKCFVVGAAVQMPMHLMEASPNLMNWNARCKEK